MQKQARKYCGVDSTSMTIERAQDLLESLLFTVWLALGHGVTKEEALTGDPGLLVEAGQSILKDKLISVKLDWKFLCQDLPKVRNVYYDDTVKNLGLFFQNYNLYYEAHQIPCSIDYWLLHSVPEETKGICFIEEYLSRLQLENDFVTAFDSVLVERLMKLTSQILRIPSLISASQFLPMPWEGSSLDLTLWLFRFLSWIETFF